MLNHTSTLAMVEDILKHTTTALAWRHLVLIEMAAEGVLPGPAERALMLLHEAVTRGTYGCDLPLSDYEDHRDKENAKRGHTAPASTMGGFRYAA